MTMNSEGQTIRAFSNHGKLSASGEFHLTHARQNNLRAVLLPESLHDPSVARSPWAPRYALPGSRRRTCSGAPTSDRGANPSAVHAPGAVFHVDLYLWQIS